MNLRTPTRMFPSDVHEGGFLAMRQPLPSASGEILDPFLLLHHHGPRDCPPGNTGLPFGPHPHRGFQTATFIFDGDVAHRDSTGRESVIGPGGVQWMHAGAGIVHEELSSDAFRRNGGPLELVQLWINLPARLKMSPAWYDGRRSEAFPVVELDGGRVRATIVSGKDPLSSEASLPPPITPAFDIVSRVLSFEPHGHMSVGVPGERVAFLYVVRGSAEIAGSIAGRGMLVAFDASGLLGSGTVIEARASIEGALVLFCHAEPLREPVVMGGPFVMNSEDEVRQAFADVRSGKLR